MIVAALGIGLFGAQEGEIGACFLLGAFGFALLVALIAPKKQV